MATNQRFLEGLVWYPEDLPCPQVETDLVPRERRYISDITDVRNMRMFQQEFQATRNKISFVFTEEEARMFREWYEEEIIFGGAWFYANWPTLHKDKKIAHRFVGQPKYQWLLGANPGMLGTSKAGKGKVSTNAVTLYKVSATVELYDPRNVGKTDYGNKYTSKIYPILCIEDATTSNIIPEVKEMPAAFPVEDFLLNSSVIVSADYGERLLTYRFGDDAKTYNHEVISGEWYEILIDYRFSDDAKTFNHEIVSGEWTARLITYPYYDEDNATIQAHVIVAAEWNND